jgi:hypothetical protein
MHRHGSYTGARAIALGSLERARAVRLGVIAASCIDDETAALQEVELVASAALAGCRAAQVAALALAGAAEPDGADDELITVVSGVISGLHGERTWLESLLNVCARHAGGEVSAAARRDAVHLLGEALRQVH